MAAGDTFSGLASVANNAYLAVQPGVGAEAVIHNIVWDVAGVSIEFYDGTNSLIFDTDPLAGGRLDVRFHVTNGRYLRVKNTSGATGLIAYDGMQTK